MKKSLAGALRSIDIGVTDLKAAENFYTQVWNLAVVARNDHQVFLRGSGAFHHILVLHESPRADVRLLTFSVDSLQALEQIAANVPMHGGELVTDRHAVDEPGGGVAIIVRDPQQRLLRFVHGDERHDDAHPVKDHPVKITHVVFNSSDVSRAQEFYERALGFILSDRTRIMAFMRCGSDHHSVALADADDDTLNHIAFQMPDLDSVMRGGGRMCDAGYPIEWGVGRHGPGNNAFAYFIGPSGFVIEYTAEVEQVDDSYVARGPDDWKWPPGRVDQWGISGPPSDRIKAAQKTICFQPIE